MSTYNAERFIVFRVSLLRKKADNRSLADGNLSSVEGIWWCDSGGVIAATQRVRCAFTHERHTGNA
ncbi:MAG: hypothetical protein JW395_1717 [Nitrospira sp.]|nr:hypothetical protein [Nitrospira sp.]